MRADNYQIIIDEDRLKEFIDWLPDLKPDETFYVCLFARNKYVRDSDQSFPHIRSDKAQMKRFTSKKDWLIDRIKQLECELGTYKQKGLAVPQEALVLYINPNPRSEVKAAKNSLKKIADLITRDYEGWSLRQEVMSEIHKAVGTKHFLDFDFDGVDLDATRDETIGWINQDALTFIKTRGGFHMVVHLKKITKEYEKIWYKRITSIAGCDVRGDNMLPVVGCYQGGFVPHFVR